MFYKNHKSKNKLKSISATSISIYILLGVLSIVGIGIGIYKLFSNNSQSTTNNSNNNTTNDNIKSCKINNNINLHDPINIIQYKLKNNNIHVENKNIPKLYQIVQNIKNEKNNFDKDDTNLLKPIQLSLESYQQENLRNQQNISLKKNNNNSFLENRRLENFGVICYSNSLMQAIYSCENLKNFLLLNIQQNNNNQNLQYIKNVFEYFDSTENVNDPNLYELNKLENFNYFIQFFNKHPRIQLYEQQSIIELYDKILEEVSEVTNIQYRINFIDNHNKYLYQDYNKFSYQYINNSKVTYIKNNWFIIFFDVLNINKQNIIKNTKAIYIDNFDNANQNQIIYELKSICLKSGNASYGHYICIDSNNIIYNDNYNERIDGIFDKVCKDGFYDCYNIELLFYNAN